MPNGFLDELKSWQRKAESAWAAMQSTETRLAGLGKPIPAWKKGLIGFQKILPVGGAYWIRYAASIMRGKEPPPTTFERLFEPKPEEVATQTQQYETELTDYSRAVWFSYLYGAGPEDLNKAGITDFDDYIRQHPPEPGTSEEDLARAREYIDTILGVITPVTVTPEEEALAKGFITEPLETRPRFKGIHLTTVEEMVKWLKREVPPAKLPSGLEEAELLKYLEEEKGLTAEQLAEIEAATSPWTALIGEYEQGREQIRRYKAGLETPEMPEKTMLEKALLIASQPALGVIDALQPYWTYWDYPRAAQFTTVTAGVGPLEKAFGVSEEQFAELKQLQKANIDTGMDYWMSWSKAWQDWEVSEWYKVGIEITTDPINLLGFGLFVKAARAVRGIPVLGRMLGVMGATEMGFIKAAEAPFTMVKTALKRIPMTASQRSIIAGKEATDAVVSAHGKVAGVELKKIPYDDFVKLNRTAIDYALANPEAADWFADLGRAYLQRPTMSHTDLAEWAGKVGSKLTPDDITPGLVEALESIVTHAKVKGSRFPTMNLDVAAKEVLEALLQVADNTANMKVMKKLIKGVYGDVITKGRAMARLPMAKSLMQVGNTAERITMSKANQIVYFKRMHGGFMAAFMNNVVDPFYVNIWRDRIERSLIMPFARAYLISGAYLPWNYGEEIWRTICGRGGAIYGKNAPKRLARLTPGLMLDRDMLRGAYLAEESYKDILTRRLTKPLPASPGIGEMSQAALLEEMERAAGKPAMEKLLLLGWLPGKKGNAIHEALYFPIRGSQWVGGMERCGYTTTRYLDNLGELAPDIMRGLDGAIIDPPKIPGLSGRATKAYSQAIHDMSLVGPDAVAKVPKDFSVSNIKLGEANAARMKYTEIGVAGDHIMAEAESGKLWDNIPKAMEDSKKLLVDEVLASPEIHAIRMRSLVDTVLAKDIGPPETREALLGYAQLLRDMSEDSSEVVSSLFVGLHKQVEDLSGPARAAAYEAGYLKIAPFLDEAEMQARRILEFTQKNVGDLLTPAQTGQLNKNLDMYMARVLGLQDTRRKAMAVSTEMIHRHVKVGSDEWINTLNSIWDPHWAADAQLHYLLGRGANTLENMIDPRNIPKPIIDASARGLTPADVGALLYAPGDKLAYAIMNSEALMRKPYFMANVIGEAEEMAVRAGTTRQALGFTDDAISNVYDQLVYAVRSDPAVHGIFTRKFAELDNFARDLESIRINGSLSPEITRELQKHADTVADNLRGLDIYKAPVPPAKPLIRFTEAQFGPGITEKAQGIINKLDLPPEVSKYIKEFVIDTTKARRAFWQSTQKRIVFNSEEAITPRVIAHEIGHSVFDGRITDVPLFTEYAKLIGREDIASTITRVGKIDKLQKGIPDLNQSFASHFELYIAEPSKLDPTILSFFGRHFPKPPKRPPVKPRLPGAEGSDDWWKTKQKAMDKTMISYHQDYTDYYNFNALDAGMRHIYPYWGYEAQRWFWLPRNFVTHPGIMNFWGKFMDNSDFGYIHIPGTNLDFNITRGFIYKGGLSSLVRRDYPEYYDQMFPEFYEAVDYGQRLGFFPNVFWNLLTSTFGGREHQFGQILPVMVRTPLDMFVAANPGSKAATTLQDILFPDYFRSYMHLTSANHLASDDQIQRGINGEYIWNKIQVEGIDKLTPEEAELWAKARGMVAKIGPLMEHGGIYRLRHEDRIRAYELIGKYKEEITGISPEFQLKLRRHGHSLGDVCPGLSQWDMLQIEEADEYMRWMSPRVTAPLRPSNEIDDNLIQAEFWGLIREHSEINNKRLRVLEAQAFSGIGGWISKREYIDAMRDINKDNAEHIHKLHGDNYNPTTGEWDINPDSKSKYKWIPITTDQRAEYYAEKGINLSMNPFDEMLAELYRLTIREKIDPETDRAYMDWGTYFATLDAIEKLMPVELRAQWDAYVTREFTPGRRFYKTAVKEYLVPYWNVGNVIKKELFTLEEQALIDEYYRVRAIDPARATEITEITRPDGLKLTAQYRSKVTNAHKKLRMTIPILDAHLLFWNRTTTLLTPEAELAYNQLVAESKKLYHE